MKQETIIPDPDKKPRRPNRTPEQIRERAALDLQRAKDLENRPVTKIIEALEKVRGTADVTVILNDAVVKLRELIA